MKQWHRVAALVAALGLILGIVAPISVYAAQINNRKMTITDSAGGATGVSYTFTSNALPTSGTAIKSVDLQVCDTASGSCTHSGNASGFSASSSQLNIQPSGLGAASGWTVDATSQYDLRIKDASNSTNPSGSVSIQWDNVTNPSAQNATFYLRMTTYTGSDFSTGPTDSGTVAVSTAQAITLTGTMDENLVFCVGTSITGTNCGTISGTQVNFGTFSSSTATTGTSVMAAGSNATSGYNISVNGTTLTCGTCAGSPTISALTTQTASSTGSPQFGFNLKANTNPSSFGADPSGDAGGTATSNYGTQNQYRFVTGDSVASSAGGTNNTAFTSAYIVNVPTKQAAGTYTTTLTYICTANY